MSRNCKLGIAVIFGFFVFWQMGVFAQTTSSDDAYCQSISICGSAAKEFTLMIEFSQELLAAIKTVWTQWSYLGKYVSPDRFVWNTFSPPQQGILGKAATSLGQKLNFLLATTAIFTSPQQAGGLKDIFAGIMVLFKNSVFARDLQRVEKLDSDVTQKRYELGLGWWWTKTIRTENIKVFQAIIDGYIAKWLLDKSSKISDGAKYSSITTMVGSIDAALKWFLSSSTIAELENLRWSNGISIILQPAMLQSMQRQYDCARWTKNMCDTTYKNFLKNMKSIGSWAVDKVKKSLKTFEDAAKKLTELWSQPWENPLKKTIQNIKVDVGSTFSQWRSATVEDQSKNISALEQNKTDTSIAPVTPIKTTSSREFSQWMFAGMSPLRDNQQRDSSLVNFSEVKDFSPYFDVLWQKILAIKNIIWDKDADLSLSQQLGQSCELQCGWIDKKCR